MTCARPLQGAALRAVYLCTRLCHCHRHSHVGSLLIFHSHIPIRLFPPPSSPDDPPSVVASFSRYSLPLTSLLSHSSLRRRPSQRPSQTRNPGDDGNTGGRGGRMFLSACPTAGGDSLLGSVRRERGGCISSRPTSRGMQMSLLSSPSPACSVGTSLKCIKGNKMFPRNAFHSRRCTLVGQCVS